MKTVLGCLMCLVLTMSQGFAISGGPDFGGAKVSATGTFAGVLYPINVSNSLGLFTVQIPKNGLGSGSVFLFDSGSAYSGTMQATADPDTGKLSGYIDAGFNFIDSIPTGVDKDGNPTFTITTAKAQAAGGVKARVRADTRPFAAALARLTGTSLIQFNPLFGNPPDGILYQVVGFKQANL